MGLVSSGGLPTEAQFFHGTNLDHLTATSVQTVPAGQGTIAIEQQLSGVQQNSVYVTKLLARNSAGDNALFGAFNGGIFTPGIKEGIPVSFPPVFHAGDIDGDGLMDIYVSGRLEQTNFQAQIYRNSGAGFELHADVENALSHFGEWLDWDGDGDLDLINTISAEDGFDAHQQYTFLFTNNRGQFTRTVPSILEGLYVTAITVGDFNNDTLADLAVGLAEGALQGTVLLLRSGKNTWMNPITLSPYIPASLSAMDYDNDGFTDLVAFPWTEQPEQYRNMGNAQFRKKTMLQKGIFALDPGAWGDLNGDGWIDVVAQNRNIAVGSSSQTAIFTNRSGLAFEDWGIQLPEYNNMMATVADMDLDGKSDVVLSGARLGTGYVTTFVKNFGATFLPVQIPSLQSVSLYYSTTVLDLDADQDLDLFGATNFTTNYQVIELRNNLQSQKSSPPQSLKTTVLGTGAILEWDQVLPSNPHSSHSFNVRLGTAPGSADVIHPLCDLNSGRLILHRLGNCQFRPFLNLTNLPPGRYYWSVQAVDPSFIGSSFANEQTFEIGVMPPSLAIQSSDQTLRMIFSGQRGQPFVIEESPDLKTWTPLTTGGRDRYDSILPRTISTRPVKMSLLTYPDGSSESMMELGLTHQDEV